MKKRVLATIISAAALAICSTAMVNAEDGLIKVGIINNDPNESGYRTANDADLQKMFCE